MLSPLILLLLAGVGALAVGFGGGGSSSGGAGSDGSDTADGPASDDPDASADAPGSGDVPVIANAPATRDPDLAAGDFDIGWNGLTAEEQLMVELINRARMDPQAEVDRLDEGLASGISSQPAEPLAVTPELSRAARAHSRDMDDRDFFAHQNPSGQSPSDRAIEEGHGSRYVGENIAWAGSTRQNFDAQDRVESHHEGLWESDGHQRNLMGDWSEIGVGYDYGDYNGYRGSTFVTEMFGDREITYLTGVVIDDSDNDDFYDIGEGLGGVQITAYDDDDVYGTETWDAGGYALELPPGTYRVVFEGGGLGAPFETVVAVGSENVKLDVIRDGANVQAQLVSSAGSPAPAGVDVAQVLPAIPVPEHDALPEDDGDEDQELDLLLA